MSELNPVFSTGRGGAGNMVSIRQAQSAENQVVMQEAAKEKRKKKDKKKHHKHHGSGGGGKDDGEIMVSYGRGGAGNIRRAKELPSPKIEPQQSKESNLSSIGEEREMCAMPQGSRAMKPSDSAQANQLKHVYTVGRGGAGNVVRGNPQTNFEDDISPVHSGASGHDLYQTMTRNQETNKGHKFIRKIKGLFN